MHLNITPDISIDSDDNILFTLGISDLKEELNYMPVGGVWWLNVEDEKDAINLINQIIISQKPTSSVAVVAWKEMLSNEIKYHKQAGSESVQLFSLPDSGEQLGMLSRDLMCSLVPEHYLFIILYPQNAFDKTDDQTLLSDLKHLSLWAQQQHCSLLLINTGNNIKKQHALLLRAYQAISGLAQLTHDHRYDVAFWCNQSGVSAGQRLTLQYHDYLWHVVYDARGMTQNYGDENTVISHIDVLEGAPGLSDNWQVYENNKQVFASGSSANAATVIFYFTQGSQLLELIQQIHSLRIQRGNALKIIIREKYGKLRAADVQLLLNCGATLVIPEEVSLPRSLNIIKSVQGTHFSQNISPDLQELLRQMKPKELKGYQSPEIFINTVRELMQNALLPVDQKGILVALRPVPGLRPQQIVTVCRIKRMGDIVTVSENSLLLFLAHCHINEMESVLRRLFPLTLSNIFSHCLVWHTDIQIMAQLNRLEIKQPIVWQNETSVMPALIDEVQVLTEAAYIADPVTTHTPVPFTLLNDIQVDKSL